MISLTISDIEIFGNSGLFYKISAALQWKIYMGIFCPNIIEDDPSGDLTFHTDSIDSILSHVVGTLEPRVNLFVLVRTTGPVSERRSAVVQPPEVCKRPFDVLFRPLDSLLILRPIGTFVDCN